MTIPVSTVPKQKQEKEQEAKLQEKAKKNEKKMTKNSMNAVYSMKWWGIGITVLVAVVISIYFTRKKWLPLLYIAHFNRRQSSFIEAYEVLLKQLQRVGLHRNEGQTLRDYAAVY